MLYDAVQSPTRRKKERQVNSGWTGAMKGAVFWFPKHRYIVIRNLELPSCEFAVLCSCFFKPHIVHLLVHSPFRKDLELGCCFVEISLSLLRVHIT